MEYQKVLNLLDNIPDQPPKFRTKSCVEVNDESKNHMVLVVIINLKLQW